MTLAELILSAATEYAACITPKYGLPMTTLALMLRERYAKLMPDMEALRNALVERGITLLLHDALDLSAPLPQADGFLLQSVSGYYKEYPAFLELLARMDATGKPVINPTGLIRWNSDKRYLQSLEQQGISVIPTLWTDKPDMGLLTEAARRGWHSVVAKPSISARAYHTVKFSSDDQTAWQRYMTMPPYKGMVMLQPFAEEILTEGEWSLIFLGGTFSHAVLKTAKSGDYRVQHTHGGSYHSATAPEALRRDAEAVFAALPEPATYARIDGIQRNGRLMVMEVEVIEPFLYLLADDNAIAAYADALATTMEKKS